jgi:hypothetical protein
MHLERYNTMICAVGLALQAASGSASAQSAVITAPTDGTWFNGGDSVEYRGDAAEAGQGVELQILNPNTQSWTHSADITASTEGFVNDKGETRYPWSRAISPSFTGSDPYCEEGVTRDDGQRSNAVSYTVWGWGDGPMREPGHYITMYEACGRESQQCCYKAHDICDPGLECGRGCNGRECGRDICVQVQKPADPPSAPPAPPAPPPAPPTHPSPGGVWWVARCECSDSFNWYSGNVQECAASGAGGPVLDITLNASCSRLCENSNLTLTAWQFVGTTGSCEL